MTDRTRPDDEDRFAPTPERGHAPASTEPAARDPESGEAPEIDPVRLEMLMEELRREQSLAGALLAGLVGAAVAAALWGALTYWTGYQIGFAAIGVGLLVGLAVRWAGKGLGATFGLVGAFFSLLGCIAGNVLAGAAYLAREQGYELLEVLSGLTVDLVVQISRAMFSPMDLLFYALALWTGYETARRKLSAEEIARRTGQAA